jgi:hypothetical protein
MSALGHKGTSPLVLVMSALPPKTDIGAQRETSAVLIGKYHATIQNSVIGVAFAGAASRDMPTSREIKGSDCASGRRVILK